MKLSFNFNKWLIYTTCFFLATIITSCRCKNPQHKQTSKPDIKQRIKSSNPNPPTEEIPEPTQPQDLPKPIDIAQAIQKLEEEARKPNPDPKLQAIYEVIKLLPPKEFRQNPDGSISRITNEKSGIALFDKLIEVAGIQIGSPKEAVSWLIDQQLLAPNEPDKNGHTPLEKIFAACTATDYILDKTLSELAAIKKTLIDKGAKVPAEKSSKLLEKFIDDCFIQKEPSKNNQNVFDFLTQSGITLTPDQASGLLEKLIEKQLTNNKNIPELLEMAKFLEAQGATIPSQNALTLLEKFIRRGPLPSILSDTAANKNNKLMYTYVLDTLKKYAVDAIDKTKATELLEKAGNAKISDSQLYTTLLDLGADPNLNVNDGNDTMPLLHYIEKNRYQDGFKEVLKKLIENPKTDINAANQNNLTVAILEAYNVNNPTQIIEYLLKRPDLDINNLKDDRIGELNYTLLDMVILNCMETPTGHVWQQEKILENSKRWLATLKKMNNHPNFYVTVNNIQKATKRRERLDAFAYAPIVQEAILIADEALKLLEDSPKRNI
jgi:hypothetical protein